MKKIEVYYKKSIVIFISVIFFAGLIFCLCDIVNTVITAAKGGKADIEKLLFLNVICLILIVGAVQIFPLRPQVIADENCIACRLRKGVVTTPWSNIKRIYLTESDVLIIEVLNLDSAKSGEKVQIPLSLMDTDALKFTEEMQNMLEEYKNAN